MPYTPREAKWLADDILEQMLGVYTPPTTPYDHHVRYVRDALSVPVNRATADRVYIDCLRQIGTVWGTLVALHGYTWGESFAARNVGVKSVWEQGHWRVKLIFMDHDDMHIMATRSGAFDPLRLLEATRLDGHYVELLSGGLDETSDSGETGCLAALYQVDGRVRRVGKSSFVQAMRSAYQATQATIRAIAGYPDLRPMFDSDALRQAQDWDTLVRLYITHQHDASDATTWREKTRQFLVAKAYDERTIRAYISVVERFREFFVRYAFLYVPSSKSS